MDGILKLHSLGIVHRDLKPQNILVSKDYRVFICDMGISKIDQTITNSITVIGAGTLFYIAPEISENKFNKSSDIYSFGIILFELLFHRLPFDSIEHFQKMFTKGIMIPDFESKDINSLLLFELMKKCVKVKMDERPTIQVIQKELLEMTKKKTQNRKDTLNEFEKNLDLQEKDLEIVSNYVQQQIVILKEKRKSLLKKRKNLKLILK